MRFFNIVYFSILSTLLSKVSADVDITSPSLGDSYSGSSGSASVKIAWDDSDDSDSDKSLDNVKSYTILLCTGPDEDNNIQCLETALVSLQTIDSHETTVKIDNTLVPNGYYYFQIYTVFNSGVSPFTTHLVLN